MGCLGIHILILLQQYVNIGLCYIETVFLYSIAGLKIYFTGPSDKMSDDFEFGSDIYVMMSDDLQFSVARK